VYLMKALDLTKIRKPYFGYEDIARVRGIGLDSAKTAASRYVRHGILVRVRRNLYVLREVWNAADREDKLRLANLGQSPSYVSLMTALDYYDLTTQMQRDVFESVAVKRTKELRVNGSVFRYSRIDETLYFGFIRHNGFFIALPEKALIDAVYLMSYGRYALDIAALDAGKLDRERIQRLSRAFPSRTRVRLKKYGYLSTA